MRRPAPARRLTALLATLALVGAGTACSRSPEGPDKVVAAFVAGWPRGSFTGVTFVDTNGAAVAATDVATQIATMSGDLAKRPPTIKAGTPKVTKQDATVTLDVSWPVTATTPWTYQSAVPLSLKDRTWRVVWSPAVFHPQLSATDKLTLHTTAAARGGILDGAGNPLVTAQPVVTVGIEPKLVTNLPALIAALGAAFATLHKDVDLSGLPAQVKAAGPTDFVEVVTLRAADYQQIRAQIHDLPGTVFRDGTQVLAPSATFARALLGTVGPVTKQRMDARPGRYAVGDQVGFGGLQERYDDRLRGTPGTSVTVPGANGEADRVLYHGDPVPGPNIKITIDPKTQNAAEAAMAGTAQRSAIVAIRISDGALLAVANGPGASPLDFALTAQVPPGSMFKTITATNLLDAGKVNVNTVVNCPKSLTVNGYTITNAGGEVLGAAPLHVDFAQSCNTAFASLAPQLGPTGLRDTAAQLGIGVPWDLGVDVFSGKVSANGDATEQAAAAFGQGTTLVSPVVMAGAAAAAARGQWKQPVLVLDPAAAKPAPDQPTLKPATLDALHQMMREVVTSGTGVKCKNVPGPPISGKTGTAEYDNNPAHTHSWFMGFRGDIAFAVFVENGGASTEAAVPMAAKFFTLLGP